MPRSDDPERWLSEADASDSVVMAAAETVSEARRVFDEAALSPSPGKEAEVVEFHCRSLADTFRDRLLKLSVAVHVPTGVAAERLAELFIDTNRPSVLAPVFASSTSYEDQKIGEDEIGAKDLHLKDLHYFVLPNAVEAEVDLKASEGELADPRKLVLHMAFDGALASLDGRILFQQVSESTVLVHDVAVAEGLLGGSVAMGHAMIFDIEAALERALEGDGIPVADELAVLADLSRQTRSYETFKVRSQALGRAIGILRIPLQGLDTLFHMPEVLVEFANALSGREYDRAASVIKGFLGLPYSLADMPLMLTDEALTRTSDGISAVTRSVETLFDRFSPKTGKRLFDGTRRVLVTLPSLACQAALAPVQWQVRLARALLKGQWDDLQVVRVD